MIYPYIVCAIFVGIVFYLFYKYFIAPSAPRKKDTPPSFSFDGKLPHEVFPDIPLWEEGDRLYIRHAYHTNWYGIRPNPRYVFVRVEKDFTLFYTTETADCVKQQWVPDNTLRMVSLKEFPPTEFSITNTTLNDRIEKSMEEKAAEKVRQTFENISDYWETIKQNSK